MNHDVQRDVDQARRSLGFEQLEPDGGNFYRPHVLQVHSGRFWRCRHGKASFYESPQWRVCLRCAIADPRAWYRWNFQ